MKVKANYTTWQFAYASISLTWLFGFGRPASVRVPPHHVVPSLSVFLPPCIYPLCRHDPRALHFALGNAKNTKKKTYLLSSLLIESLCTDILCMSEKIFTWAAY